MGAERDAAKRSDLEAGAFYILRDNILLLATGPQSAVSFPRGLAWASSGAERPVGPLTAKEVVARFSWYDLRVLEFDAAIARQGEKRGY
jgi:hypothetical protein